MALFKPFMGNRTSLDAQPLHDGYAYFCIDDGSFHIDYVDDNGDLQRKQINAKDAETLMGVSLDQIMVQADFAQTDSTQPDYIKNKPTIPSNMSDLNNDIGYINAVDNELTIESANPIQNKVVAMAVNNLTDAVSQKSLVQFITWEEND